MEGRRTRRIARTFRRRRFQPSTQAPTWANRMPTTAKQTERNCINTVNSILMSETLPREKYTKAANIVSTGVSKLFHILRILVYGLQSSHPRALAMENLAYRRIHTIGVVTVKQITTIVIFTACMFGGSSRLAIIPGGGWATGLRAAGVSILRDDTKL